MKEDFGTEGRGGYYDSYGVIRDVIQNHLLQARAPACPWACTADLFALHICSAHAYPQPQYPDEQSREEMQSSYCSAVGRSIVFSMMGLVTLLPLCFPSVQFLQRRAVCLQILALICMERPVTMHPDDIRDEKTKVIRAMRTITDDKDVVVGQYTAANGKPGYTGRRGRAERLQHGDLCGGAPVVRQRALGGCADGHQSGCAAAAISKSLRWTQRYPKQRTTFCSVHQPYALTVAVWRLCRQPKCELVHRALCNLL